MLQRVSSETRWPVACLVLFFAVQFQAHVFAADKPEPRHRRILYNLAIDGWRRRRRRQGKLPLLYGQRADDGYGDGRRRDACRPDRNRHRRNRLGLHAGIAQLRPQ